MTEQKTESPYPIKTVRSSLIASAIIAGVYGVDLFFKVWGNIPYGDMIGGVWAMLAIFASPIGTYRGARALKLDNDKPLIAFLVIISLLPVLGFFTHIIMLAKLHKASAAKVK